MEGRRAHVDLGGEVVDPQGPGEVAFQPVDGPCDLVAADNASAVLEKVIATRGPK